LTSASTSTSPTEPARRPQWGPQASLWATATLTISPPVELLPFGIVEQPTQAHPTSS